MKRVLPILLLISALEIWGLVELGECLFKDRYINISEVTILDDHGTNSGYPTIHFLRGNKTFTACMSYSQYESIYKRQHKIIYTYADTYITCTVLYIIFCALFDMYFVLRTLDFFVGYTSYYDLGDRFGGYNSLFPDSYYTLHNKIDAYDLTPIKNRWNHFWGY